MIEIANKWIVCQEPNPDASVRLFCFPYAGGSASAFRTWATHIPPYIEVCAIQLPGHETRLREPLMTSLPPLTCALADALAPYLDKPFTFFGHSMGAIICFELARKLRKRVGRIERILIADHTNLIPIVLLQFARRYSDKPARLVVSHREAGRTYHMQASAPEISSLTYCG